jgi:hypothetical protein
MGKNIGKIIKQTKIWMTAASVIPVTALSGMFFLQFIGWTTTLEKLLTIGAIIMFFVASIWWWWAVNKIVEFANMMKKTDQNLQELKTDIASIKTDIKQSANLQ